MDWLEVALKYGLPTVILMGISVFFVRNVWPFIVRAWEEQQEERRIERRSFLDALAEERKAFQEVVFTERVLRIEERDKFLVAIDKYGERLEAMGERLEAVTVALIEINTALGQKNAESD